MTHTSSNSSSQSRRTDQPFDQVQAAPSSTDIFASPSQWQPDAVEPSIGGSPTQMKIQPGLDPLRQSPRGSSAWWQRLSVRTKAVFLGMVIGTSPILLVGTTTYLVTNQSIRQQVLASQENSASNLERKLNNFMDERYGDIQSFAQLNVFADPQLRNTVSLADKQKVLDQYLSSTTG